jgi:hypothetical protein
MTTDNNNKSTFGTISIPASTLGSISFTPNSTASVSYGNMLEPHWSEPYRYKVDVYDDRIEMIYIQYTCYSYSPSPPCERRVYKIIYSCVDGKWNVSEPIYGKIIPATEETYEFED